MPPPVPAPRAERAIPNLQVHTTREIEAGLTKRGIGVHNYKSKSTDVKMEEWLNHPWVIISIEQLEKLESCISTYQDGNVVFDEFVTGASSIVNGVTVRRPSVTTMKCSGILPISARSSTLQDWMMDSKFNMESHASD